MKFSAEYSDTKTVLIIVTKNPLKEKMDRCSGCKSNLQNLTIGWFSNLEILEIFIKVNFEEYVETCRKIRFAGK